MPSATDERTNMNSPNFIGFLSAAHAGLPRVERGVHGTRFPLSESVP